MINIHTIDFEFYENKAVLPMNRTMGNVMTGNNFFFTESSKTIFHSGIALQISWKCLFMLEILIL